MFFKKKMSYEFDRNMTTAEANKTRDEVTQGMPPEMVTIMDFFTYTEKVSMGVDVIGGTVEVARRMSESKTQVVLLVIDMLGRAKNNELMPNSKNTEIARKIWEELIKHMTPEEYKKFDELYISKVEHGETALHKLMSSLEVA